MFRLLYQLILLSLISLPFTLQAQFWASQQAIPDSTFKLDEYERHECTGVFANIDGKRLCITLGGRAGAGKVDKKRPIIYDIDANTLTMGENGDDQYHHFQAALWRDSIIVVGMSFDNGYPNEIPQEHLYLYYIKSETWVEADTVPTARMRGSAQCVVYEDTAYFFNGLIDGHKGDWVKWTDRYDLANGVWDTLSPSPRARDHAVALLDGTDVYVTGGRRSATGNGGLNQYPVYEIDVYDIITDTWRTLPDSTYIPELRAGHQAVIGTNSLGHKEISIWGGEIDSDALASGLALDLTTNKWSNLPDMLAEVHGTSIIPVSADTLVIMAGRDFSDEHLVSDSFYVQVYYGAPSFFPIEWIGISAREEEQGSIELSWTIQSPEEGTFVIEKKTATDWTKLGSVDADPYQTEYEWSYTNTESFQNEIYRVHLQMANGTQSYSPLLSLRLQEKVVTFANPLPAYDKTLYFLNGRIIHAEIYTIQGAFLGSRSHPESWQLPDSMGPGKYLLKMVDETGNSRHEVIMVQ